MLELAAQLLGRARGRTPFVAATVTGVAGSAPRQPGSSLVVDADGAVLGNVSGGCVDAVVHEACQQMLAGNHTPDHAVRALRRRRARRRPDLRRHHRTAPAPPRPGRRNSPIGPDLRAHTPDETALSIAAEIVGDRHGGTGGPLSTGIPIHRGIPSPRPLTHSS